ncbi:hypothetical protein ANMWB30_24390 [Arthrobacter sp. MWB30]|nr:hypothetical protein ANMWB30_24390 [Arthrobacter sp. MWB30]
MRDLTGKDIGTTIDFRTQGPYEARCPWPAETHVSAGLGVVFQRNIDKTEPASYKTLFLEVYPPGASFIRGEGATPEACEDAAWKKYQLALNCTDHSGHHDWQPRGYRNGAGFCSRCNTFAARIFTGEQLGQFCEVCSTGRTFAWHTDAESQQDIYLCQSHYDEHKPTWKNPSVQQLSQLFSHLFSAEEEATQDTSHRIQGPASTSHPTHRTEARTWATRNPPKPTPGPTRN